MGGVLKVLSDTPESSLAGLTRRDYSTASMVWKVRISSRSRSLTFTADLWQRLQVRAKELGQTPSAIVDTVLRRYLSESGTRSPDWKRARTYARKNAQRVGIRSERDIQRAIDEYRQGNFAPYAPARRR